MSNRLEKADAQRNTASYANSAHPLAEERAGRHVWMLKRHSSATTSQLCIAFGVVAGIVMGTAALFALSGAWFVLPCAFLEIVIVGGLCWLYTRRERAYDCVELYDGTLTVVCCDASGLRRIELNSLWTKITLGTGRNPRIEIRYGGSTIAVGAQVPLDERKRVVKEVNRQLTVLRSRNAP